MFQLPELLVCAHLDNAEEWTFYEYNRLTKALTALSCTETDTNPYTDHTLFNTSCTVDISYKFSTKKGRKIKIFCV